MDEERLCDCWDLIQARHKEVKERERHEFERDTARRKEEAEAHEREIE